MTGVVAVRVLSVCGSTRPAGEDAAWLRIDNIANGLLNNGIDVEFVYYVLGHSVGERDEVGSTKKQSVVYTSSWGVHFQHLIQLRRGQYDLVLANTHWGCFLSLLGRLQDAPLVFDMHGDLVQEYLLLSGTRDHPPRYYYNLILNHIIDRADISMSNRIICVSHHMMESLGRKGVRTEKMIYAPNGVDLDFYRPYDEERIAGLKSSLGLDGKFVVGYVGGSQKWQGLDRLLSAARRIRDDSVRFLIVGGANQDREGNILFVPKVPKSRVKDYYAVCDVLALPRPFHPATDVASPMKFAEYVAMGKPVLSTNVGDAADHIRKYGCGIVVKDNDSGHLAEGIDNLRTRSRDELADMGKRSRRVAETEFSWRAISKNLASALASVAER